MCIRDRFGGEVTKKGVKANNLLISSTKSSIKHAKLEILEGTLGLKADELGKKVLLLWESEAND